MKRPLRPWKRVRDLAGVFALFFGVACGAATPSPSDEAAIVGFEAEQIACVFEAGAPAWLDAGDAGPTPAQQRVLVDMCRCAVHVKYGRACADGGAP